MKYIYYTRNINGQDTLFRIPNNLKSLSENISLIEVLENDVWVFNSEKRKSLLNDYMTGWLIENDDQLKQEEVINYLGDIKIDEL